MDVSRHIADADIIMIIEFIANHDPWYPCMHHSRALFDTVAKTCPEWLKFISQGQESQNKSDELLEAIHASTGEEDAAKLWFKYRQAIKAEQVRDKCYSPSGISDGI